MAQWLSTADAASLDKAIAGDKKAVGPAFEWHKTSEGYFFWYDYVYTGKNKAKAKKRLKEMALELKQYQETKEAINDDTTNN